MSTRATTNNANPNRKTSEEKPFLRRRRNRRSRVSEASCDGGGAGEPPKRRGLMSRPIRFLKRFAGEIARVLCMVSSGNKRRSSAVARSKPLAANPPPLDSQRVEAIEDCIQFINSSCTFSRSNSTTGFLPRVEA